MSHSNTATVIASFGQRGLLYADGAQLPYMLKGRKLKPVCGDRVDWEPSDNADEAVVTAIQERANVLERPDSRSGSEALAANLDVIAVVMAPEPKPDFFISDRFICAAELMNIHCVLVWNKTDLPTAVPVELSVYRQLGYPVIAASAMTGDGMSALLAQLNHNISMLVGQSGVGKSSVINQLVENAAVPTGALSDASREGRHTTTASVAHRLANDSWLVDSPGIRDFEPAIAEFSKIQNGYVEIVARADHCRFADCKHTREPNCAVRSAVDSGDIDQRRYDSYKRLLNLATAQRDRNKH